MSTSSPAPQSSSTASGMSSTSTQGIGPYAKVAQDIDSIPSLTLPPLVLPISNEGESKSVQDYEEIWTQVDKHIPRASVEDILNFIQSRLVQAHPYSPEDSETSGLAVDMVSMIMQEFIYLEKDMLKALELRAETTKLQEQVTMYEQRMESSERHKKLAQASLTRSRKVNEQQSNEIVELKKTVEEQDARLKRLTDARKNEVISHVREVAELNGQQLTTSVFRNPESDKDAGDEYMLGYHLESLSIGDHPLEV